MTNVGWLFNTPSGKTHVLCMVMLLALQLGGIASGAQTSRANHLAANEHLNKGNLYLGRRQFTEALEEYGKAVDLDPNNSAARNNIVLTHLNWGAQYFSQKHFDEARKEWETVLQLDPYNRNAKHNISVLEQTLARLGSSNPSKQPAKDSSTSPSAPGPAAPKPAAAQSSAVIILTPGLKQSQNLPDKDSTTAESQPSEPPQPPAPLPQPTGFEPVKSQYQSPSGSLEDQLSSIEMKIYGHTLKDMTVLKRLEKIEMDSNGQVKSGTIKDRIDLLKQTYGL